MKLIYDVMSYIFLQKEQLFPVNYNDSFYSDLLRSHVVALIARRRSDEKVRQWRLL
jgi:hypothetical protein